MGFPPHIHILVIILICFICLCSLLSGPYLHFPWSCHFDMRFVSAAVFPTLLGPFPVFTLQAQFGCFLRYSEHPPALRTFHIICSDFAPFETFTVTSHLKCISLVYQAAKSLSLLSGPSTAIWPSLPSSPAEITA